MSEMQFLLILWISFYFYILLLVIFIKKKLTAFVLIMLKIKMNIHKAPFIYTTDLKFKTRAFYLIFVLFRVSCY